MMLTFPSHVRLNKSKFVKELQNEELTVAPIWSTMPSQTE